MTKFVLFCLVTVFASALSSLNCYDCDPTSTGGCIDPEKNNIRDTVCNDLSSSWDTPRANFRSVEYHCVAVYAESNDTTRLRSGIYRGCLVKEQDTLSACDYLKSDNRFFADKPNVSGKITCYSCKEDKCNTNTPDGAASLSIPVLTVLFGTLFSLFFLRFLI